MKSFLLAACLGATAFTAQAQDKFTVSGKADLVSNYVWRGIDQGSGFSVQPQLGLSYKGVFLTAWGSQSLTRGDAQEFDLTLGYTWRGLTVQVADLWWGGLSQPYGYYKHGPKNNPLDGGHHFEGTVSYRISDKVPLTLSWNTWFAGADVRRANGNRCFSTYINAAYDVALPAAITLTPSVGFTPWRGYYHDKAAVTDISLKAARDMAWNDKFPLPLSVQVVVSPPRDHVYLVAGVSVGF